MPLPDRVRLEPDRVIEVRLRAGDDDSKPWLIEIVTESESFEHRGGRNVNEAVLLARKMVQWSVLRQLMRGKKPELKLRG
jgi:hypothetical protein